MSVENIINLVTLAVIAAMFGMSGYLLIRNGRNKKLIKVLRLFNDEELFFEQIDLYITSMNKYPEFVGKGNVLKLWGLIYYDKFDQIDDQIDIINIPAIINQRKNRNSIALNEDSFFYLCLACPNALYARNKNSYITKLNNKINENKEVLSNQLVWAIGEANYKYYFKKDDLGEGFYKKVLDGDYSEYRYAKQLIGLYKNVITCMLARIYQDSNRIEEFEQIKDDLINFNKTTLGGRYIQELKLQEYIKEEEETPKEEIEEVKEESKDTTKED